MSRFYLDLLINTLLLVVLAVIWTLIIYTITDSRVHGFILAVIGGVFIALINFYKEPINEYLRTVINNAKKK